MTARNITKRISVLLIILGTIGLISSVIRFNQSPTHWQYYLDKNLGTADLFRLHEEIAWENQTLYFNSENHHTYALDLQAGKPKWTYRAQDHSPFPPLITSNFVIVSSFDGNIHGLNKKNGQLLWKFLLPESTIPDTAPVANTDQSVIFTASRKGMLLALETESGQELWRRQLPSIDTTKIEAKTPIHFGALWYANDLLLAVHGPTNSLYAFNAQTGEQIWDIKNFKTTLTKPVIVNGFALFSQDKKVTSVNLSDGKSAEITTNAEAWENQILIKSEAQNQIAIVDKDHLTTYAPDLVRAKIVEKHSPITYQDKKQREQFLLTQKFNIQKGITEITPLSLQAKSVVPNITLDLTPFTIVNQNGGQLVLGNATGHVLVIDTNEWTKQNLIKVDHKVVAIYFSKHGALIVTQKPNSYLGFTFFNQQFQKIWEYTPSRASNVENIYQFGEFIVFTTLDERIIETIEMSPKPPNNSTVKTVNFTQKINESDEDPYLEIIEKPNNSIKISQKVARLKYWLKHFLNLQKFSISQQDIGKVKQIIINHPDVAYENPQSAIKISAEFLHKTNKLKYKIAGYYATNNTWAINFLPPEIGEYDVKISIKSPLTYQVRKENFMVEETDFNPLTIKEHFFVDQNNRVFLPFGIQDTFIDWNYNGDNLDQIQASKTDKPVAELIDFRYQTWQTHTEEFFAESNINFYRYGVGNWTPPLWYKFSNGQFVPLQKGGNFGDRLTYSLKEQRLRVMMTIFGFYPPYDTALEIKEKPNQQALKAYLDYVVARYSAFVDMWEIGNEAISDPEYHDFITKYLKEIDPYHHPVSTNWEEPSNQNYDFVSLHHYEPSTSDATEINNSIRMLSKTKKNQPIIFSELGSKDESWFEQSIKTLRYMLWLTSFEQHGVAIWNQGQNGIYQNPDNANYYLGPKERTIMRNLKNFLGELTYPTKKDRYFLKDSNIQVLTLTDQNYFRAYLLNLDEDPGSAYFKLPVGVGYEVQLIEPATERVISTFVTQTNQENFLLPLIKEDLAIKINLAPTVL